MAIPLAAVAIGTGVARAGAGIFGAGKRARKSRDLIKRAYKIAQHRQEQDQGYTRESVNESLNARGVLTPGASAGMPSGGPIADAYNSGNPDARRMAVSSVAGQQGPANTLSGQVNNDLSAEFYREQQDLWNARAAGIDATKGGQAADTVNALGAGIDTGTSVYSIGKMLGAGRPSVGPATGDMGPNSPGAQVRFPRSSSESGQGTPLGGMTIRGAFGIDPVDPLGLNKRSNYDFNVGEK